MKVLITGGKGFIGSRLATALKKQGENVSIFDLPDSITDLNTVTKVVKQQFDFIYHFAGISGTADLDPTQSFLVNVRGTINLLEAVRLYSPKSKIVFSNSRQEYGKPQYLPVDEKHPTNPISHYGVHKLAISMYAQLYAHLCGLDIVVLRTSNVYGPPVKKVGPLALKVRPYKQPSYNIINHWLSLAQQRKDITIFGSGNQLRDYLYIDDFLEALIQAGTVQTTAGQIFNIGYGQGTTMLEMAKIIAQKYGVKIVKKPWPNDWKISETGSYVSSISKASKLLSWNPQSAFIDVVNNL